MWTEVYEFLCLNFFNLMVNIFTFLVGMGVCGDCSTVAVGFTTKDPRFESNVRNCVCSLPKSPILRRNGCPVLQFFQWWVGLDRLINLTVIFTFHYIPRYMFLFYFAFILTVRWHHYVHTFVYKYIYNVSREGHGFDSGEFVRACCRRFTNYGESCY